MILNFEAAQCARDPRFVAVTEAIRACDELKERLTILLCEGSATGIKAALERVQDEVEEAELIHCA